MSGRRQTSYVQGDDKPCKYYRRQPSPRGRGWCAQYLEPGTVMDGNKGGKQWVVKDDRGYRYWHPVSREDEMYPYGYQGPYPGRYPGRYPSRYQGPFYRGSVPDASGESYDSRFNGWFTPDGEGNIMFRDQKGLLYPTQKKTFYEVFPDFNAGPRNGPGHIMSGPTVQARSAPTEQPGTAKEDTSKTKSDDSSAGPSNSVASGGGYGDYHRRGRSWFR